MLDFIVAKGNVRRISVMKNSRNFIIVNDLISTTLRMMGLKLHQAANSFPVCRAKYEIILRKPS